MNSNDFMLIKINKYKSWSEELQSAIEKFSEIHQMEPNLILLSDPTRKRINIVAAGLNSKYRPIDYLMTSNDTKIYLSTDNTVKEHHLLLGLIHTKLPNEIEDIP